MLTKAIQWTAMASVVTLLGCGGGDVAEEPAMEMEPIAEETMPMEQGPGDIVAVAQNAGTFNTLVAAVEAAGLVGTLQSDGPFTVFAPTDEAFEALPEGTVEDLLANPDELSRVLTYHVIPGRVMASDVIQAGELQPATVQGAELDIEVMDGTVHINDATVVTPDVEASNGVIHVIDSVLMPPAN